MLYNRKNNTFDDSLLTASIQQPDLSKQLPRSTIILATNALISCGSVPTILVVKIPFPSSFVSWTKVTQIAQTTGSRFDSNPVWSVVIIYVDSFHVLPSLVGLQYLTSMRFEDESNKSCSFQANIPDPAAWS